MNIRPAEDSGSVLAYADLRPSPGSITLCLLVFPFAFHILGAFMIRTCRGPYLIDLTEYRLRDDNRLKKKTPHNSLGQILRFTLTAAVLQPCRQQVAKLHFQSARSLLAVWRIPCPAAGPLTSIRSSRGPSWPPFTRTSSAEQSGQAPCICPWGPRAVILVVLVLVERKLVRTAEIKQWAFLRDKFKPIEWNCLN